MSVLDHLHAARERVLAIFEGVVRMNHSVAFVREALGRIEARQCAAAAKADLISNEFKVTSQWGEDGILQHLLRLVAVAQPIFVEFGVQDYTESNTRFLLINNNWSGLVLDGSAEQIAFIRRDPIYWRYNVKAVCAFITRENIDQLLKENGIAGEIGLLSIDIDGNDYWVWESITSIDPAIVIVEYNARFGPERAVTVPYDASFQRAKAHHSCIYYGASLAALVKLGSRKGYAFVGTNSAGNNAFFVRRDLKPPQLPELTAAAGYVRNQFRETRDQHGKLTYASQEEETVILEGLPLVSVEK